MIQNGSVNQPGLSREVRGKKPKKEKKKLTEDEQIKFIKDRIKNKVLRRKDRNFSDDSSNKFLEMLIKNNDYYGRLTKVNYQLKQAKKIPQSNIHLKLERRKSIK
jgi:hypothetical protein